MPLVPFLKKNADSLVAAAAGFIVISLFTRHGGIGVCPDSVVYLTTAENLHAHGKLSDFTQSAMVDFPGFYPFFLSAIMLLTGQTPLLFAPVLNALLFALIIYLTGFIMDRFLYRSHWYKIAVLTCIALSPCLLEIYSMLWSETLFLPWLLLFMIVLHQYFQSYSRKMLIAAAVIAALASVTRYAGITIIGTGAVLMLVDAKLAMRKRVIDILLFSIISSSLLVINLARNFIATGTMTGGRESSITPLRVSLHDAGSVFYDWISVLRGHYTGAGVVAVLVIAGLGWVCLQRYRHNKRLTSLEDIAVVYSFFYLVFMIAITCLSRFEALNSRFFAPVFIPLIWSGSNWLVAAVQKSSGMKRRWVQFAGIIIFLGFQYNQLSADYETWDGVKDAGIPGYTEDQWRYSETVQFIEEDSLLFRKGYTIYSNANDAVYFFTGRQGKFLPHKELKKAVQQFLDDPHCYVVWFDDGDNPDLVSKDFITRTKGMKLLKQFSDGAVYIQDQ